MDQSTCKKSITFCHTDSEFKELTDQATGTHHRSQSPSQSLSPSSLPQREPVCLKRKNVLLPAPGDRTGYHNKPTGIHGYGLSGQCGQRRQRIPSTGIGGYCSLCPRSRAMSTSKAPWPVPHWPGFGLFIVLETNLVGAAVSCHQDAFGAFSITNLRRTKSNKDLSMASSELALGILEN